MNYRWLAVAALVLASEIGNAAHEQAREAAIPGALSEFVDALRVRDLQQVMSFFSASKLAQDLVPEDVWMRGQGGSREELVRSGHRSALEVTLTVRGEMRNPGIIVPDRTGRGTQVTSLADNIELPSDAMVQVFEDQLGVRVLSMTRGVEPVLIFAVDHDDVLRIFDGADKGAAELLRPSERPTLGMVLHGTPEPFVTFWQQEGEPAEWRIVMVGRLEQ